MKVLPRSLFGRAALTIALTLVSFTIVSMAAVVYFIMLPMAKRSADDFAAEFVSAAHDLQHLPEERHTELMQELLDDHGLVVVSHEPDLVEQQVNSPYLMFFRDSLTRVAGEELPMVASGSGPLIWVDVPAHGQVHRIGFNKERLGTNPPLAFMAIVGGGALFTLLASLLEVHRVVRPLDRLSRAVRKLSQGQQPQPVPEDGPEEIVELARTFNRMSSDLQEMAANRTVMIAGISHDLRTPLTRLGIAVEMLDENSKPELVAGIQRDLDAMNDLISQFLQFSKGIEDACPIQVDLWKIIESLAEDTEREGADLRLHRIDPPCVFFADPVALQRVVGNLLKNAAQYGGANPIDVELHCSDDNVSIEVADRGPGIPEGEVQAVFRPFHRLQPARETRTGGSGLGLAIAHQLAVKHGWTIELAPREGGGTVAKLGLSTSCRFSLA
jgi:two-component system, OmpR family, osmolarity sensor histidine kinase EnvZ